MNSLQLTDIGQNGQLARHHVVEELKLDLGLVITQHHRMMTLLATLMGRRKRNLSHVP